MSAQNVFDSDGQLDIGQLAPEFSLPGTDGKTYSLDDFRGSARALVVIFSCNHCPYVIKTEERMINLAKEYKKQGVEFVLICSNDDIKYPQDGFDAMKVRAKEKGYPFPYLRDDSQNIAHAYGAQVTPHVYLFDGEMILRYRGYIDDNINLDNRPTSHDLRMAVEAILEGNIDGIKRPKTQAVGCSIKWK